MNAQQPIRSPRDIEPARVGLDASACLPERFPGASCARCLTACAIGLLERRPTGGPRLRPTSGGTACIGCGQCAAVCPSAALRVEGFALAADPPHGDEVLIDCWRVPVTESPAGALRVPCLGGLTTGWLLALFERGGERPIRLLDRGQCEICPAGAGIKELLARVRDTRLLLHDCGVEMAALPMLVFRACAAPLLAAIPEHQAARPLARRAFFRALLGETARVADAARNAPAAKPAPLRAGIQPVEPLRVATALTAIAARHGRHAPARAFARIELVGCVAHGVCAGVCPTGALALQSPDHRADEPGVVELRFAAAACIACGECARACPSGALHFASTGGRPEGALLARWERRECTRCGADFSQLEPDTAAAETTLDGLCPICRRSTRLTQGVAAHAGAPPTSTVPSPACAEGTSRVADATFTVTTRR